MADEPISDVSSDDGGVVTEEPTVEVETPVEKPIETPSQSTKTFIHNNQTYNLSPAQETYLIQKGFDKVEAEEKGVTEETKTKEVKPETTTVEDKIQALETKIQKQEQTNTFEKNNAQIESEFTKLLQPEDFSERGTQLVRELTFSVMGRQRVGTTQAFNLVKETLKGYKDEIASSKEVRSKNIQDYIAGKISDSELTLGETSPGKASGMTDDKPMTMGGLTKGEAGQRLRAKLSKV